MARAIAVVGFVALSLSGAAEAQTAPAWSGRALYDRLCAACHGAAGDGRGPARSWLSPPPRDLVRGPYKWATRPEAPTTAELAAAIDFGVRGTSMPGFAGALSTEQRDAIVEVVAGLRGVPARAKAGGVAPLPPAPSAARAELRALGARLWLARGCAVCHGARGAGDGPLAAGLRDGGGAASPPYDLTAGLRRPHDVRIPDEARRAAARSIASGVPGTAMMPVALPPAELWALAEHVASLASPPPSPHIPPLSAAVIAADRARPLPSATWPGAGDDAAARLFGGPIARQGPAPAALAPAQASLSAQQCGRCHPAQERAWRGSIHARAASPGLRAQYVPRASTGLSPAAIAACQACHGPLPEQAPGSAGAQGGDEQLASEGVTCAACHVRAWQRLGPPRGSGALAALPGYPATEAPIFERSDFCLPCHQLPARSALAGRPTLDTYREWLLGPYAARGVQCQHCHMPSREHSFLGIHDPRSARQALRAQVQASRSGEGVAVQVELENVGAGHYFPTTPTPAVWVEVELVDASGRALAETQRRARIGRHLAFQGGALRQLEDTRIAPGEVRALAWRVERAGAARRARLVVRVAPDDYYEGFYAAQLAVERSPAARALLRQALAAAKASHYQAFERSVDVVAR